MYIQRPDELFMPCIIKPMEDKDGLIIAIKYDACKCMLLVRYFDFSGIRTDWFYDFELEMKPINDKDKNFFRSY